MSAEVRELRRAIACLAVEVPGEVWDDVSAKTEAVLAAHELCARCTPERDHNGVLCRDCANTELAEAREDVARCAADTTAVDLAQDIEFLKAEREQMHEREQHLTALLSLAQSIIPRTATHRYERRRRELGLPRTLPVERWWYVLEIAERPVDKDGLGPTYRLVVNELDPGRDGRWLAETGDDAIRLTGRDGIFAVVACDDLRVVRHPEIHPVLARRGIEAERAARENIHDRR